ncbi:MAG: PSD1 and planctomycete cytochrome C domain-containing protein [Phycisphaeraceae bacterium]
MNKPLYKPFSVLGPAVLGLLLVATLLALLVSARLQDPADHSDPSDALRPVSNQDQPSQTDRADEAEAGVRPVSFNRDVRPILSDKCFACHGFDANTREAGLRLDVRDATLIEYDTGTPIVPGDPDASSIIQRVESDRPNRVMPPPTTHKAVSAEELATLRRWIEEGAAYEPHWAFIPPTAPDPPEVSDADWVRNDVDRFVLAKLEEKGLSPSPEADRRTLIRRVYLDLVGLPPTPEEVEAFVKDASPDAYENVVDELLASAHHGERMAMPWLDAARYADSNSFQFDNNRWAWPWRDWLIEQINDNRPFDKVIIEMLAGDLLENPTQDQMIATAFNRNHFINGEGGAIKEEVRFTYVLDRVETTSTTFLGLTYACAQCHDHKYDPISIENYYEFFAFFGQTDETGGRHKSVPTWDFQFVIDKPYLSIATDQQKQEHARLKKIENEAYKAFGGNNARKKAMQAARAWANRLTIEQVNEKTGLVHGLVGRARYGRGFQAPMQDAKFLDYYAREVAPSDTPWLEKYIAWNDAQRARMDQEERMPIVMTMGDREKPIDIKVRDRGLYSAPIGEPLTPGLPDALGGLPEDLPRNRLGLAKWMVSDANPLTARVLVNRLWQQVFGKGLVNTPEDFGMQSPLPSHPDLLDHLAVKYRTDWDTKAIMREIVTSATYRQSSAVTPEMLELDPENKYLARGARFRLPAMLIRDQALATSGLFNDEMFGPPVYPYQPPGLWVDVSFAQFEYTPSSGDDLYRRSLYTFFRRTLAPPNLFDNASRQACTVKLSTTNTPLQALTLLNDPTYVEAARALALRAIEREPESVTDEVIQEMFRLVTLRDPEQREMNVLKMAYAREYMWYGPRQSKTEAYLSVGEIPVPNDIEPAHLAALSSVALTILNLDEAMTKE